MKIISIGTDENILVKGSRTYERVREYSDLVDEYFCLVFTKNKKFKVLEEGNLPGRPAGFKVIPIYGRNKFFQVRKLLKIFYSSPDLAGGFTDREDIVLMSQDAFEIGFLCHYLARKFNLKLIIQMHTEISTAFFWQESYRNLLQFFLAKFVLPHADAVRVVSQKMQNYLTSKLRIHPERVHLLPIYTDVSQFKFKKSPLAPLKGGGSAKILMISRIEEVKNIPLGIRAVQAFRKISKQDIKLRIVGRGNLKQKYLKTFKDRDWVEWADWSDEVEKEFHDANLLLVTSNYEGWGLTAVESVASGTPVVISPVGVANEFIVDGVNGFVARGHDIVNIMEAIYHALNYNFDEKEMKKSLEKLDTKQEYLSKLKGLFESTLMV